MSGDLLSLIVVIVWVIYIIDAPSWHAWTRRGARDSQADVERESTPRVFASVCYVAQETACFVRPHQRTLSTNWVKQALRSPFFSPPLTCIFDARHGQLCKPVSVRDGLIRDDRAGTFFRRQRVKPEHALRQRWTSAGGRFFRSFSRCVVLADVGRAIDCTSNSSLSSNSPSVVTLQILTLFDPTNICWMILSTASCWPDFTR